MVDFILFSKIDIVFLCLFWFIIEYINIIEILRKYLGILKINNVI